MHHIRIIPRLLHFRQPAGTSRGVYTTRKVWYVLLTSDNYPGRWGIGECAPLPGLSCDDVPNYEDILEKACRDAEKYGEVDHRELRAWPSILFGLETAFRHFNSNGFSLWDTPFSRGEAGIPINGLIWMGDYDSMLRQIEDKMSSGFRCIKLKIGAIGFEEELSLLHHIRRHFPSGEIELRVDANGAFSPSDALEKLTRLAELDIHSIEQPIMAGQWEDMARLTRETPLPIALDEELIGINDLDGKYKLLKAIRPQYIILKPSLHGGMAGSSEWIEEAKCLGIGWWITSALESNIGLNAIAQFCATFNTELPQGLGTGGLFTNNIDMPLAIRKDCLWYEPEGKLPDPDDFLYTFERSRQYVTIEGVGYSPEDIRAFSIDQSPFLPELHHFLMEWFDDSPNLKVQTSGSTGTPKQLTVLKARMMESARLTCSFLGLKQGDHALLCMHLQYIGAKMMVVRSLVAGLDLLVREPSGHPLADVDVPLQFAAMVPLQVYNSLNVPEEKKRLEQIGNLIIGGGPIDPSLEEQIRKLPNRVYSTYGMTETLSHIALRRLNGDQASQWYTPFDGIELSQSSDGTLIIDAPRIHEGRLTTNDLVELRDDGSFRIIGRKDNVIISGGVKINAEELERKICPLIPFPFAVTSFEDARFGEALVLITEQAIDDLMRKSLHNVLSDYEYPKHILKTDHIPQTGNGKINRVECRKLARQLLD